MCRCMLNVVVESLWLGCSGCYHFFKTWAVCLKYALLINKIAYLPSGIAQKRYSSLSLRKICIINVSVVHKHAEHIYECLYYNVFSHFEDFLIMIVSLTSECAVKSFCLIAVCCYECTLLTTSLSTSTS